MFTVERCSFKLHSNLRIVCVVLVVQLYLLRCSSCGLQVEQQAANSRHQAEVFELKEQLRSLNSLVERGSQALQQKAQVRITIHVLNIDLQQNSI